MSGTCTTRFSASRIKVLVGMNGNPMSGSYCEDLIRARRGPMRTKGALHIHSKLSRDGTMTIAELASWYKQNGYGFIAMGEHAEDLDEAKVEALRQQSLQHSNDEFCVVPGIEFAVTKTLHIVG